MAYEKQNFVKGQVLEAEHLNHIEDGIEAVESKVDGLEIPSVDGLATTDYVDEAVAEVEKVSVLADREQNFSDEEKAQARANIGFEEAVFDVLLLMGAAPVILDNDGSVLVNNDNTILLNM